MEWHLGTMGFGYKQWVGAFYPAGMASGSFLAHYSQIFGAVEVDSTYYGTPRPTAVVKWADTTPDHFIFCPKTPKAITQASLLPHAVAEMEQFVSVMSLLGDKLGPILIQFSPNFTADRFEELATFLAALPPTQRYAVEFRDASWLLPQTAVLLRQHRICWAAADYIHLPKEVMPTTDLIYLRLIGPHGQFATKDKELIDQTASLHNWYNQIQQQAAETTAVYVFCNNDYAGFSPATLNRLRAIIGLEQKEIRPLQQGRLF